VKKGLSRDIDNAGTRGRKAYKRNQGKCDSWEDWGRKGVPSFEKREREISERKMGGIEELRRNTGGGNVKGGQNLTHCMKSARKGTAARRQGKERK